MESNGIESLFARATDNDKFLNEKKRQIEGIKRFRREIFGLSRLWLGGKSVKTLDEMGQILYNIGMASSVEEGREITPSLMIGRIEYGLGKGLVLEEVKNRKGDTKYSIQDYHYNPTL